MATEMLTTTDRIQEAFEDLECEKTLITNCTKVWKDLSDHFSSLEQTLAERSQSLDSKIEALDTETQQALEALDDREASIPDREVSAAALIEERKAAAISEMEDPDAKLPEALPGILRLLCRWMDSAGLWRFLVARRKDLSVLRKEVADAVASSVDPPRLVLDAVDDFVNQLPGDGAAASAGGGDRCWALGMLLRTLFDSDGKKGQEVSGSVKEKAAEVAEAMKAKLDEKGEGGGGMGGPEAQLFLQLVVVFGLSSKFEQEFLKKLVLDNGTRKEIAKLVVGLGFGEKLADIIDELVKTGKEIGALYFAHESGLTERFPPIPLIKSYLQSSKKNAYTILKNGNHSSAATEESSSVELGALRSVIKCVETLNLESKFTLDGLRKRLAQLERAKADRKKNASAKSQSKRLRGAAGGPSFRPAKAGRTSNVPYASFHRNPPASHPVPATRHPYNYLGQVGFDGPASSFGAVHSRSPTAISQPYYVPEDMTGSRTGMPYGGASVGYGGYDYAAPHTAPAQPAYPHLSPHQH